MNVWLRHHRYALKTALKRLRHNPMSSLANIFVIALILCVPLIGAAILQTSQPLVQNLDIKPEITLFLNGDVSQEKQAELLEQIKQEPQVTAANILGKDKALQSLKQDETWAQALQALDDNPLPDAILVTLVESPQMSKHAKDLANKWHELDEIESAQLDDEWVKRLESLLNFIKFGMLIMAIAVAVVVIATVFNTVRLQALSQREEISVARLVGATESFVRRPFLYLGAVTSLVAFLLAILLTWLALMGLNIYMSELGDSYGMHIALHLPSLLDLCLSALVIIILGAIAARLSVTRYKI